MATYTFLTSSVKEVTRKINRIINKCKKQGIPYTFNVSDAYDKIIENKENKNHFSVNVTDIEIDVHFKFNGWTSLGAVTRKDGIVQCFFKDANLIKQYKDTDFHCDHCKRHAHRNSVVILEHENGERKIVGTSCVEEFTCGLNGNLIALFNDLDTFLAKKDAELGILLQGESLDDMPISVFCERNGVPMYDVEEVVACASRLIRINGYENSSSDEATWKFISSIYNKKSVAEDKDAHEEAKRAIAWISNMIEEEYTASSYLFNLHQIINAGQCSMRHFGLLVSIIPSYQKSEYKRIMAEKKANKPVSNHYGNIGDKFSLNLTYTKSITYESQFGIGFFHFFTDDNGNVFKWSTSNPLRFELKYPDANMCSECYTIEQGAVVKVSGRIKDHDEYQNEKQTVITRCKCEVIKSENKDYNITKMKEVYEQILKRKNEQHPVDKALDCMEMCAQYREKYC